MGRAEIPAYKHEVIRDEVDGMRRGAICLVCIKNSRFAALDSANKHAFSIRLRELLADMATVLRAVLMLSARLSPMPNPSSNTPRSRCVELSAPPKSGHQNMAPCRLFTVPPIPIACLQTCTNASQHYVKVTCANRNPFKTDSLPWLSNCGTDVALPRPLFSLQRKVACFNNVRDLGFPAASMLADRQ